MTRLKYYVLLLVLIIVASQISYSYGQPHVNLAITTAAQIGAIPLHLGTVIINDGNETAKNIKLKFIDESEAFKITTSDRSETYTLAAGEKLVLNYTAVGKKIGIYQMFVEVSWEDENGKSFSKRFNDLPMNLEIIELPPEPDPFGAFGFKAILVGVGIAVMGLFSFILMKKRK